MLTKPLSRVLIRAVVDEDSDMILGILRDVFAEYDGCVLELSEVPELLKPAAWIAEVGGRYWIAELDDQIVGMVALVPSDPSLGELRKLYTVAGGRGIGLGRRLIELVEGEARARGMQRVHLWTDTRFVTAHSVYERCGYVRLPEIRVLNDASNSLEYHYQKMLAT